MSQPPAPTQTATAVSSSSLSVEPAAAAVAAAADNVAPTAAAATSEQLQQAGGAPSASTTAAVTTTERMQTTAAEGGGDAAVADREADEKDAGDVDDESQAAEAGGSGYASAAETSSGFKLFVGGLSWSTTSVRLQEFFEQFGSVSEAVILRDKVSNRSRGFGFVTLDSADAAEQATQHPHVIDGRTVEAKAAVPRDEMPRTEQSQTRKLFVGSLPLDLSEDQFREHFEQFGELSECLYMRNRATGVFRGFGFVTYVSESDAAMVLAIPHIFDGREAEVKRAEPKRERSGSGGRRTSTSGSNNGADGAVPATMGPMPGTTYYHTYPGANGNGMMQAFPHVGPPQQHLQHPSSQHQLQPTHPQHVQTILMPPRQGSGMYSVYTPQPQQQHLATPMQQRGRGAGRQRGYQRRSGGRSGGRGHGEPPFAYVQQQQQQQQQQAYQGMYPGYSMAQGYPMQQYDPALSYYVVPPPQQQGQHVPAPPTTQPFHPAASAATPYFPVPGMAPAPMDGPSLAYGPPSVPPQFVPVHTAVLQPNAGSAATPVPVSDSGDGDTAGLSDGGSTATSMTATATPTTTATAAETTTNTSTAETAQVPNPSSLPPTNAETQ